MENLTKTQIVLLTLLVSFMTSLATGIVTVSLMSQAPAPFTQTVHKVIEKITPIPLTPEEKKPEQNQNNNAQIYNGQEEALVKMVKDISPSVASVVATKDIPVIEEYYINPFGDIFPDFQIPQYKQKGTEKKQVSSGTGFFVSRDGLLVTNRHVVEDADADYSIIMTNGQKLDAKVLARDPFQDIAILKVEGSSPTGEFKPIPLGDSDSLNVGQTVIAIGNTLGEFQNTVSVGIISGLHRSITAEGALSGPVELQELIQTDAAINPGNSGGPLLDIFGRVIGINVAVAQSAENVGFALPINVAKRDIADAKEFGKIKYPYIGIRYKVVENGVQLVKGPGDEPAIDPNGPAEKAGLKEGDIILEDIGLLLSKYRVADTVALKILRDGKEMTVSVILGERPENL
ncbi:MAG: trypsin-like peptidase domain-containing protein [Candidatus Terrybacteria bacterium]|nr:trypsin-like peptidase domain-containing protein [Candidatus Terrybacteria bacterium]